VCGIGGLDHDPHQGLGAGLAQQHPTHSVKLCLGCTNRCLHHAVTFDPALVHAPDVDQHLWQSLHDGGQALQRTAGLGKARDEQEPGHRAVTCGSVVEEDDMPGLLATQGKPAGLHLLQDVAVTHRGLPDRDALALERLKHAQIAHHGGDERVLGERTPLTHAQRQNRHDLVAVHVRALGIHRKATVSVAIQGDATVCSSLDHGLLQLRQVGGTVTIVDIETVGLAADHRHRGTRLAEGFRRNLAGRAVGGVQDHVQAVETMWEGCQKVGDVPGRAVLELADPPDAGAGGPVPRLVQARFDGVLELVCQLVTAPREELDAVVRHRVVRCRQHDAQIGPAVGDQERDGRGGQHPCVQDVHPR